MWKYVSRRIRDTFERSANHFDKRGTTGVVNATGNVSEERNKPPCCWFTPRRCWNFSQQGSNTNNNCKWNFEHLTSSWIGAITWSSALVIGWYTSQLIHLKYKCQSRKYRDKCPTKILSSLSPYIQSVNKNPAYLNSATQIEQILTHFTPTVHLISNGKDGEKKERNKSTSSSSTTPDSSDDALGDVLNSIENKLGLAAIENGQLQDGLNLLRSAANRNHAPALYNLGLCYELGLGVNVDEKVAMEMYRSAAALEHPGALYNLGIYYGQGRGGLVRDTNTATRLLRLAAVQGQQDAIDALKSLDLDPEPQHNNAMDSWSSPFNHQFAPASIVPSPTTLFMENINYSPPQNEASVY